MEQATLSAMKHVLVVDDDASIVQLMEKILRIHHYQPLSATHWTDAMEYIEHQAPDLLLLDLAMPTVDGASLLDFIRERDYNIPVIVVSAHLTREVKEQLLNVGVSATLEKPFKVDDLVSQIELAIGPGEPNWVFAPPETEAPGEEPDPENFDAPSLPQTPEPAPQAPPRVPAKLEHIRSIRKESEPTSKTKTRRRRRPSKKTRRRNLMYIGVISLACLLIAGNMLLARYTLSTFSFSDVQDSLSGSVKDQILQEMKK
ncbi:MAG: response regulator [bacterium]|nr:response regulator [bacterium]